MVMLMMKMSIPVGMVVRMVTVAMEVAVIAPVFSLYTPPDHPLGGKNLSS